jgi:hypothetical protein
MNFITWISEAERLPDIAQDVLFLHAHGDGFFKVAVACILVAHEGVQPRPADPEGKAPTDFWWNIGGSAAGRHVHLATGKYWWAPLTELNLPAGAEHRNSRGMDYIVRVKP